MLGATLDSSWVVASVPSIQDVVAVSMQEPSDVAKLLSNGVNNSALLRQIWFSLIPNMHKNKGN
jgi:muramidase (phage lysozyme)